MTDISAIVNEVGVLKQRLDLAQLSYRDSNLKSRREIVILKRLITRLVVACRGIDNELDTRLQAISVDLEQPLEISRLIPRLAIVERLVIQQADVIQHQNKRLQHHISQRGRTLSHYQGLPLSLQRDLRGIFNQPSVTLLDNHQRILRLLELYERSIKLISASNNSTTLTDQQPNFEVELAAELLVVISEIDFTNEQGEQLFEIREQLTQGVNQTRLQTLLLQVLRLIVTGTHAERHASQQFLNTLNSDLASLQKNTAKAASSFAVLHQHRCDFNTSIATIATTINQQLSLKKTPDTTPLLVNIANELQQLAQRNSQLEQREQALIEQLNHNDNKVNQVQQQTYSYHQRLSQQEQNIFRDKLTLTYNRSAFDDRLEHEYQRWLRYQTPLLLMLIDIDDLSLLNKDYGHHAGDKALKIIAKTISQQLSPTDFIARFSDDAFMLIITDCNDQQRHQTLQNIRAAVSQLPLHFKGQSVAMSVSISSSFFATNDTPKQVIERLETTLLHAQHPSSNVIIDQI
ncbi:diguanylate cyclase [Photobacterium aquimaris]|uniref:diguanylate cyclase n=1 Tax=Photobacterium aquimaris TaxID=512643 RepID=A0A2T3IGB9_9GAMM|nr:GGDEF domain-containing protein [Photobacterium aquimaris]OBU16764.1 diguanylate cyclase [Photobacterium aquimaris]OBU19556.1 diguanylate cyclase [Photobacterium aquimaris]PSU25830.1 GGDEF domain-containing protein [Photobacterium aquimaris]PSV97951.1 GGDEF domain-containing protein [Photobacterium aquimaris]